MSDAKLIMFDNRLKKVLRILSKQAKQQGLVVIVCTIGIYQNFL